MPEQLRFLFDEHVPAAAAAALRQKGIVVATVPELGRGGLSDAEQLQFASEEGWVLVTFDSDYLEMARQGKQHSGIAWCAQRKHTIGRLVKALTLLYAVMDRDNMQNHVEFL